MSITVDAIYDGEVFRPQSPVSLTAHQHYSLTIEDPINQHPAADAWSVLQVPGRNLRRTHRLVYRARPLHLRITKA